MCMFPKYVLLLVRLKYRRWASCATDVGVLWAQHHVITLLVDRATHDGILRAGWISLAKVPAWRLMGRKSLRRRKIVANTLQTR